MASAVLNIAPEGNLSLSGLGTVWDVHYVLAFRPKLGTDQRLLNAFVRLPAKDDQPLIKRVVEHLVNVGPGDVNALKRLHVF